MEAIYQRARPATFGEVVGQEHVKEVLEAALRSGRAGHAYLFSGPRGVGKTTTARLLAMALNCESDDLAARPCGGCDACLSIRGGRHPDVTELDAASNNSVDDVRELRERVRLASLRGGTRVWILDEAHMLSTAAANALLKTLEEPPEGLVFVLATTEPERLPATVLSRCQHFRFRRLSEAEIAGKLAGLCETAGVEADAEALSLVARAAEGAMRDAESLLERLWADGGPIRRDAAEAALGLPPKERLEALADALAADDLATLLEGATALYRDGFSPRTVAEQLARTLRDAVVHEATGADGYTSPMARDALLRTLHQFDDELDRFVRHDDLYALEAALLKTANAAADRRYEGPTRPDAGLAPPAASTPSAARTTSAAKTTGAPSATATPSPAETPTPVSSGPAPFEPNAAPPRPAASRPGTAPRATDTTPRAEGPVQDSVQGSGDGPIAAPAEAPADGQAEPSAGDAPTPPRRSLSWHQVKSKAPAQLKAFLQPAEDAIEGDVLVLKYGERHKFHFSQLKTRQEELEKLIDAVGGPGWGLRIEGPGETIRKKA